MKFTSSLLLLLALVLPAHTQLAADPNFTLQHGGVVTVDPDTNRATVTQRGVTTPLWDGTHRLEDGSVLIINRGVTVPNRAILDSRQLPPAEAEDCPFIFRRPATEPERSAKEESICCRHLIISLTIHP